MFVKKSLSLALCLVLSGCASSDAQQKSAPQPVAPAQSAPVISQAWLDNYEPRLREALKDSHFELQRRDNLLVVTAPVQGSFNPDRPHMLLPVSLGPISRVAKLVESDPQIAVLVLGHADSSGAADLNRELSQERARSVTAIFRLSGLKQDRLLVQGLGSDHPRAGNDSAQGRALNRRVEILLAPQVNLRTLFAQYSQPAVPAVAQATAVGKPVAADMLKVKALAADQAK